MSISEQARLDQASSASTNSPMLSVLPGLHRALVLVWDELPVGKKVLISQGFTLRASTTIILPPRLCLRHVDTGETYSGQIGGKHLITPHSQVDGHRSIFSSVKKLIQFNVEGGGCTKHRRLLQVNPTKKQFNRCSSFCVSTCFLHLWQLLLFRGTSSCGTGYPCQSYWVVIRIQNVEDLKP